MVNSDELLEALAPYATVTLGQYRKDTWNATAQLRIRAKGANFEVKSEFGHPTARSALAEVLGRVMVIISQASELRRIGTA